MHYSTKIFFALVVFVASVVTAFGDNELFNYTPEGKNYYTLSTQKILVKFKKDLTFEQKQSILAAEKGVARLSKESVLPSPDVTIAEVQGLNEEAVYALLARLQANPNVDYANPFLVYEDGTLQGIQDRVVVRLKSRKDLQTLKTYIKRFNLSILDWDDYDANVYILGTNKNSMGNALKVANALHETQVFDWAEPDFLLLLKRFNTNDTYLNYQWSLNNTGSGIQYSGTAGADMNVFDAWGVTNGSSSIKVAIIDEGVDLNHPDLLANMLGGYDATGQGSNGGPSGDDAHGTACAGIVAGVGNNNQGVAGVAYSCKIIPVRIAYGSGNSWVTSNTWIGNSINWAWNNAGADVLSNSWGGGGNSSTINNAISGAVNNGRGGLGAPVLFAAGNDNGAVSYPATQTNTIAVAAMSMCYERKSPSSCDGETWWGSNYGTNVDVAAPGVKVYTTDISGSNGYSSGNYAATFNGTSSATPNAAGVMALILSANPSLTQAQARYALESTCRKVGGYTYNNGVSGQPNGTWSTSLGYGLVDAYQAVLSVAPQVQDDAGISAISSPSGSICSSTINPSITLNNYGTNTLTSVTINYQVDNGTVSTYNWSGSLASTNSTTINLPAVNVASGSHTFNAYTSNPNNTTDGNSGNDAASSSFTSGTNPVTLTIVLDNYGSETTWEVRNGSNQVVANGGPYSNNQNGVVVTSNFCLADGCFDFIIYDSYGDGICCGYGQGSYELVSDLTSAVLASGGSFSDDETTNFCVQSTVPLTASINASADVSCNGGNDGSASVAASGGTTPYTYLWSNGGTGTSISSLAAGTYTVTVTDNSSNTATASVTISQPSALSASTTNFNVACFGGNNGAVNLSVSGGTSPYSYVWSNGSTSQNISGLFAGSYTVTVTDANGCSTATSGTVTEPAAILASASGVSALCFGGNGSVNLVVSGGTPNYSYNWSNGGNSQNLSNVAAGTYTVTITDGNGCTETATATVGEPPVVSLIASTSPSSCGTASDGSVDLTAAGGTGGYTYLWSNGATTQDLSGVTEGTYSVTVTDANGCTATTSALVEEQSTLAVSASSGDVECNGGSDGTLLASATGGSSPYSYLWSNGSTDASVSGVLAGVYTIVVTDANGCTASASTAVSEPDALSASASSTDVSCNGGANGSANASVSGGTLPYSYAWSNGDTTSSIQDLSVGGYTLTVTDANGCTTVAQAFISEPDALSALASSIDPSCNGGSDGLLSSVVSGGTAPYSYQWSNGSTLANVAGVSAGNYSLTVTDANSCTATTSATISEPAALSLTATKTDAACSGIDNGSVDLSVAGGTGAYGYAWSNGATTEDISGVAAGNYTVTVTDANGCTATTSATVGQLASLEATAFAVNINCNGDGNGGVSVNVVGGTSPYSYQWSNGATVDAVSGLSGGTYTVVVTDANGCTTEATTTVNEPDALSLSASSSDVSCNGGSDGTASVSVSGGTLEYFYNWSNGSQGSGTTGLAAGTYTVTVTDGNFCTATATVVVNEPSALSVSASSTDVNCNGGNDGSLSSTVSGGTEPYSYQWSNGSSLANVASVSAGNYGLTVTDANGCTAAASTSISEPTALVAIATATNTSCSGVNNGSIDLSVAGGTGAYNYAWSNGATTEDISGLSAGNYAVTVTDANGCVTIVMAGVSNEYAIETAIFPVNVSCNGANDGSVAVLAAGGSTPYAYLWSNGATDDNISNVSAGNYGVTVTDVNGCSASTFTTVSEPDALEISVSNTPEGCDLGDGTATASVSGGTAPYNYVWSNGGNTASLSNLATNVYAVTVTDANGCSITGSTEVVYNCEGCAYVTVDENDFETGWGIWNDGGNDCNLVTSSSYANSGTNSVLLRDNSGENSSTYTNNLDLANYSELTVSFSYLVVGFNSWAEDFWLQISTDGGSTFTTIEEWNRGDEFVNDVRENDQVIIPGPFSSNTQLRFMCDASGNNDRLFLDDIVITGCFENQPVPTCEDGIQNGDETGVDCGGSNCLPCNTGCAYTDIDVNDFETSLGIWLLGGSDASVSGNSSYSNSGTYSVQLRDNTNSSVMTTERLDLSAYEELTVDFSYFPVSMDNSNEDFWLQISYNAGASFTTVEEWNQGDEFNNNQRYNEQVIIPGPFGTDMLLRFRCDASGNSDWVYIDDVAISGCLSSSARVVDNGNSSLPIAVGEVKELISLEVKDELKLYPNPAVNEVNLVFTSASDQQLQLVVSNMFGQVVYEEGKAITEGDNRMTLDLANIANGVYVVSFIGENTRISQRVIVQK